MLEIKYLNNKYKVDDNVNGFQLAKLLDEKISKQVLGFRLNDIIKDMNTVVNNNANLEFILSSSKEGLEIIRHSTAHLLASAVKEIYGENVKFAIGPAIENGFYYDFDIENPFSESDLEKISKKMEEIIKRDEKFIRESIDKNKALEIFKNQPYKLELINNLEENEEITIYRFGDFVDLCRGTHVPSSRYLKNFKLTKVAGAYWRGKNDNKMLQRIYGISFDTKEKLEEYINLIKEAEKRDHRKICKSMDLLHFEPDYAPGGVFYHSKGLHIFNKLLEFMRKKQESSNYIEVSTPRVMDRVLWEISGHWEKYGEHNYSGQTEDGKQFCIKPMNCPGAVLIYKQGIKSYRDLPLKISEFGKVNRYEASGSLLGLLRVREFTQDDAHIFSTINQVQQQCIELIEFLIDIYKSFGFDDIRIKLSTRPEKRIGSEEIWNISEEALAKSLDTLNLNYTIFEGEGAFYGPKLEFVLRDAIGRDWQAGTIQLDMNLPERFDINYIGEDGQKHRPVMIHRAIFGSIERFLGILIEHTEGKFPLWISPLQIGIATINDDVLNYARYVKDRLNSEGFLVKFDTSNEKINYKIREMSLEKIPYILTIGKKESKDNSLNIRILGSQKTIDLSVNDFIERLKLKIKLKERDYNL